MTKEVLRIGFTIHGVIKLFAAITTSYAYHTEATAQGFEYVFAKQAKIIHHFGCGSIRNSQTQGNARTYELG